MYLAIIILPLLGSIVSGFFGRKIGVNRIRVFSILSNLTVLLVIKCYENNIFLIVINLYISISSNIELMQTLIYNIGDFFFIISSFVGFIFYLSYQYIKLYYIVNLLLIISFIITMYILYKNVPHTINKFWEIITKILFNKKDCSLGMRIILIYKLYIAYIKIHLPEIILTLTISCILRNSVFIVMPTNDFLSLLWLVFSTWLPIIYINGIVLQFINNSKEINFSLNTEYIKNRISIKNAIILVIFCFIFYKIKIYIFSIITDIFKDIIKPEFIFKYIKPDYCGSDLSNSEIDDWANKEVTILERTYMPKKYSKSEVHNTAKYFDEIRNVYCNELENSTGYFNSKLIDVDARLIYVQYQKDIYAKLSNVRTCITLRGKESSKSLTPGKLFEGWTFKDHFRRDTVRSSLFHIDENSDENKTYRLTSLFNRTFKDKFQFRIVPQMGDGKPCDFHVEKIDGTDIYQHTYIECKSHTGDSINDGLMQLHGYLQYSQDSYNKFAILIKSTKIAFFEYDKIWHDINKFEYKAPEYKGLLGLYVNQHGVQMLKQEDTWAPQMFVYDMLNEAHRKSILILLRYFSHHPIAPTRDINGNILNFNRTSDGILHPVTKDQNGDFLGDPVARFHVNERDLTTKLRMLTEVPFKGKHLILNHGKIELSKDSDTPIFDAASKSWQENKKKANLRKPDAYIDSTY